MARRFRFKLEVVQRLRRQALDAQRRAVAEAIRIVGRTEDRMADLTRQLRDTVEQTRASQAPGPLDVVSLRGHQFYRARLHREILEAQAELAGHRAALDRERSRLAEASKQLKVIEKLRERQWRQHLEIARREEQAEFDETAGQLFIRRASGRQSDGNDAEAAAGLVAAS